MIIMHVAIKLVKQPAHLPIFGIGLLIYLLSFLFGSQKQSEGITGDKKN